jgi:NadR type nicotinamide-nucleotide adenylyltransferase
VKKICFYGPESVGKSTLAVQIAPLYNALIVPEVAREMVFDSAFGLADIEAIAKAQAMAVQKAEANAPELLLCDTDLLTTMLYSQIYLNEIPSILAHYQQVTAYDHYFLFNIDVPWVADGLRDLGHRRVEIFNLFKQKLEEYKLPYTMVVGSYQQRKATVMGTLAQKFCIFPQSMPYFHG